MQLTKQGRGNYKVIPHISHRHLSQDVMIPTLEITCLSPLGIEGTQPTRLDWLNSGELIIIQYGLLNQEQP